MDTCWAGRGKLIGSMVPPTDPWYEDLHRRHPVRPGQRARRCSPRPGTPSIDAAAAAAEPAVRDRLRPGGEEPARGGRHHRRDRPAGVPGARGSTTVFKNADYDMSIVAHVEPRDIRRSSATRSTTRATTTPRCSSCSPRPTPAPTERAGRPTCSRWRRLIAEDAAADWLFLLPEPDRRRHRRARGCRRTRSASPSTSPALARPGRRTRAECIAGRRWLRSGTARARRRASSVGVGARVRVHGRAAGRPGPGRARRERHRRGGRRAARGSSALDRPLVAQYVDWVERAARRRLRPLVRHRRRRSGRRSSTGCRSRCGWCSPAW